MDNIVTLTKKEGKGARVTYMVHRDYEYVGDVFQPNRKNWWNRVSVGGQIELTQFRTRAKAIEDLLK